MIYVLLYLVVSHCCYFTFKLVFLLISLFFNGATIILVVILRRLLCHYELVFSVVLAIVLVSPPNPETSKGLRPCWRVLAALTLGFKVWAPSVGP